jgi:Protein of unknown function (DUF4242)
VSEFIVEVYVARTGAIGTAGLRAAAEAHQPPVRYLRAILVPEDETCYLLFDAESMEDVRAVVTRAAVPFERISTAIESEEAV